MGERPARAVAAPGRGRLGPPAGPQPAARARGARHGVTMIEFLAASSTATIVGGAMILLMTGMRQAYEAHTTFHQLSGYLDVASSTLRNDIWGATASCQGADCPPGNGGTTWLALDLPTSGGATGWGSGPDVLYTIDQTDATNIKLMRRVWNGASWGAPWAVAQFVVQANTTATVAGRVITVDLWSRRTVNGRTYTRQVRDLAHRMQVVPP